MNRETRTRLYDAKLASERIASFVADESAEYYLANEALQLIVERLLITVGEAINLARRSDERSLIIPSAGEFVGLRNRLVPGYESIQQEIIWDTVVNDLPILLTSLNALLE